MGLAEDVIVLLKKTLAEKIIEFIVTRYFLSASWLMNPILGVFMPIVINFLYDEGAFAVHWVWDIVSNHEELSSAIKTRETLHAVMAAGGNHEKAEEAFNKSADDLIHHNAVTH